jgi:glycerol-3-phosphate acyltransferase PlsY
MNLGLYLLAAYLLGAIPTGYLAGKLLRGIDIRKEGSGNMGATNVLRVLGKGPGAFVLIFDICKGAAAVALLPLYFGIGGSWLLLGALAAVLGHNYTCFLGFKGGKGVATSAGVCIGLAPHAMLWVVIIFVVVTALSRMVSLGSLTAAAALPLLVCYCGEVGALPPAPGQVFYLALALTLFIWLRHIPNMKRILAGTENKLGKKKA